MTLFQPPNGRLPVLAIRSRQPLRGLPVLVEG